MTRSADYAERWWAQPGALVMVAQPLVDLARGVVAGYELLSRFPLENARPDQVFARATERGEGDLLEAAVIARGLQLAETLPEDTFLSINVDPTHLGSDIVTGTLIASDLSRIVLELTEHNTFGDLSLLRARLDELRKCGATIAVDDAGSGYAGLQQLLRLRPQIIKLDRSLIQDVHRDEAKRSLIEMLGEFADRLDAWVLAEGIETAGELQALCDLGVPLGQGYFLGRPAEPWAGLSEQAFDVIEQAPRSEDRLTMRGLMETVATVSGVEPYPRCQTECVRLDDKGRAIEVGATVQGKQVLRTETNLLKVQLLCSPKDAVLRALHRKDEHRWDPVLVVDECGSHVGLVRMERLVAVVAHDRVRAPSALESVPASAF